MPSAYTIQRAWTARIERLRRSIVDHSPDDDPGGAELARIAAEIDQAVNAHDALNPLVEASMLPALPRPQPLLSELARGPGTDSR